MNYLLPPPSPGDPIRFFQDLCRIPRGSGEERAVSEYVVSQARNRGLWVQSDERHNVYIKKPGVGAGAGKAPVIFQAHLDMVCEKEPGKVFDFKSQPLELDVQGDWLFAKGTTLGADDGFGIAYILALLHNTAGDSPPLECLLTTEEETGLTGAFHADLSLFEGKSMVNLDGKPEGVFVVSSAGGLSTTFTRDLRRSPGAGNSFELEVTGLLGGHSGRVIDRERGNALRISARVLDALGRFRPLRLIGIDGGNKDNAIPRECRTRFLIEAAAEELRPLADRLREDLMTELAGAEPGFSLELNPAASDAPAMSAGDTAEVLRFLCLVPNGPFHHSIPLNGVVINSANLAAVHTAETQVTVSVSLRSSLNSLGDELKRQEELLAGVCGFTCLHGGAYPPWRYEENSPLREVFIRVYRETKGDDPLVIAVHAGLECGVFKEKRPDLDIISIGPDVENIHSPLERLNLPSFARTFALIQAVLRELARI